MIILFGCVYLYLAGPKDIEKPLPIEQGQSRSKQALKSSQLVKANLFWGKAEGSRFDLSKGAIHMASIDFRNLEF